MYICIFSPSIHLTCFLFCYCQKVSNLCKFYDQKLYCYNYLPQPPDYYLSKLKSIKVLIVTDKQKANKKRYWGGYWYKQIPYHYVITKALPLIVLNFFSWNCVCVSEWVSVYARLCMQNNLINCIDKLYPHLFICSMCSWSCSTRVKHVV